MKRKSVRLALCLGVLSAALACSALAAEGVSTPEFTTAEADCTVTCTDGKYTAATAAGTQAGKEYALLVVRGTPADYSVSQDTIMYIDQQTATKSGVSFSDFIPKGVPNSVVLLGGEFDGENSPKVLGTLVGQGVEVSGSVDVMVSSNVTLTLYDASGAQVGSPVVMDSDKSYSISSVPEGTYCIKASKPGFVSGLAQITVGSEDLVKVEVPLYGGDVNTDLMINAVDLLALLEDFGKSEADGIESEYADINEDTMVNAVDLLELLDNFGMSDEKIPSSGT